ncbi:hypothetical protein HC031_02255 [Planosporangium thailandense]|uniref:Subtilisin inhibitor domain-containing protein n=1 Tax=Planosporangium thailandense TaxID=765197 RepID=A0ABX0XRC3_9ACTN|nr:hypothetical protein [Planosporangium thailandense]
MALTAGLVGQSSIAAASTGSDAAASAGAARSGVSARPAPTVLWLTVAHGEAAAPVTRLAVLTCDPAGGNHPAAASACEELSAAAGDIANISQDSGFCTMIYDPVTVTAQGWWQGRPLTYRATYANTCMLHRQTRSLFRF